MLMCNPLNEKKYFDKWSENDSFSIEDNTTVLEKDPNKDFVVLNLTDIQLSTLDVYGPYGELAKATIDKLVEETHPDLITVTGDNAYNCLSWFWVIDLLDSYGIPWAPIMGNHDGHSAAYESWDSYLMQCRTNNCLFRFGPYGMGYGNYVITITENGTPIHQIFMMDTHDNNTFTLADGSKVSGYDHLWANQLEWYKWVVNGTQAELGHKLESSVFYHIPNVEYKEATEYAYGVKGEDIGCSPVNDGSVALFKEMGSTKNIICGHEHVNDFGFEYQGIWLRYSVKTGAGGYWNENINGGTKLTIDSNGHMDGENIFVDAKAFGIDYSVPYPGYDAFGD
jgi:hypothetical protein